MKTTCRRTSLQEPPEQTESFAESLGELAGASLWVALFLAVAGVILYFVLRVAG